jgi:hypothetical protein
MKIYKILLFTTSLLFLGCANYSNREFLQKKIKPLSYNGKIIKKFFDTTDRMTPKVEFANFDVIEIDIDNDGWDYMQIGDSLSKPSGSLKHTIYRKGVDPVFFYPKIEGQEIK